MSRRLTSTIWQHFDRKGSKRAECTYCRKGISTSNGSFSNLRRHLKSKHPTLPLQSRSGDSVALGLEDSSPELTVGRIKTDRESETCEDMPPNESLSEMTTSPSCGRIEDAIQHLDNIAMNGCDMKYPDSVPGTQTHIRRIMSSRRSSAIWMYFNDNGANGAECTYCKAVISISNGSISNLRRHLKSKHPTVPLERETDVALGLEDSSPELTGIQAITIKTDEDSETYEDTPLNESPSEMPASPSRGSVADGIQHLDRIAVSACDSEEFVDRVAGTRSHIKRIVTPRRTSTIWRYFNKTGSNRAECTYCKAILSTTGGSFSNLRRHFKSKHPTVSLDRQIKENATLVPEDSSPDVPELTDIQAVTLKNYGESRMYEDAPQHYKAQEIQAVTLKTFVESETYEDVPLNESRSETTESGARGGVADAFHHLDRIAKSACEEKEFEEFGRFVAAELRRVPRRQALLLQKEIQDSIFNVRMRTFE